MNTIQQINALITPGINAFRNAYPPSGILKTVGFAKFDQHAARTLYCVGNNLGPTKIDNDHPINYLWNSYQINFND